MPTVLSHPGLSVASLSAEHTVFSFDSAAPPHLELGDKVTMVPPVSPAPFVHNPVRACTSCAERLHAEVNNFANV